MPRLRHGVVSRHGDDLGANHTSLPGSHRDRRREQTASFRDVLYRGRCTMARWIICKCVCVCVCVCSSAVVAAVCVSTVCEFAHLKPFSSFFDVLKETRYPCRHRSSSDPGKTKSTHLHATDHHLTTALALPTAVCHHGPYMDRRLLDSVSD